MDKSVLHYYEQELRFLRELGADFARRFPKVAGRLGIGELTNDDPHVERLFQGFSLLAGRIQQRLSAEFPTFTETLLEQVYPHHLRPTPSMAIVQFEPTPNDSSLASGFTIPRGTELRARSSLGGGAVCQYNTAHAVELWPIAIDSLEYTSVLRSLADVRVPAREPIRALLRIGLKLTGGRTFDQLRLHALPLYVNGSDATSARLYEALIAHVGTLVLRWGPRPAEHVAFGDEAPVARQYGFEREHAVLPEVPAAFRGYRLLQEYFAFPSRFQFVELRGLRSGVTRCKSDKLELILPLKHHDPELEGKLEVERLRLFATPVVNLYRRRCDVVPVSGEAAEVRVLPDRTQPLNYEVHSVTRVAAHLPGQEAPREYRPLQHLHGQLEADRTTPQYAVERRARVMPYDESRAKSREGYVGSEVFLKLYEPAAEQSLWGDRQLVVDALCTNRDLPLILAHDREAYFTLSTGAPVDAVKRLTAPSPPRYQAMDGESAWRLLSHLNLNYLSLCEETGGAAALREMLALYAQIGDPRLRREPEGLRAISSRPIIGPYPEDGPRRFVRGLEIQLQCEEQAFSQGVLPLAAVLSLFFAKQASTHSFTQTVLHTLERGEVHLLPALPGARHAL